MTGLGDLAGDLSATFQALDKLPAKAARAVGNAGKDVLFTEARRRWGPDRRWSGAARSRKRSNSRQAGARYKVLEGGATIEWYPTGTPWYVTVLGRAEVDVPVKPLRAHAFATPKGPRASQKRVTGMRGRGNIVGPLVPRIQRDATTALHAAWVKSLAGIYQAR